ncbi:MAG: tetratricopeptide repeat protein [Azospirillaceae bacterium]|nr:tetratricopeptide repeat protein [Azospirillaceae bacterium]
MIGIAPTATAVSEADIEHMFADALAAHRAGDLGNAARRYHAVIALRPLAHEAYNNLGISLIGLKKLDAARVAFRNAATLAPDTAQDFYNLANVIQARGDALPAIALYRRALILKPDDARTRNNLAHAFRAEQRSGDALAAFRQAIELQPDFAEAYGSFGVTCFEAGGADLAIAIYRRAIVLRPTAALTFGNLGNSLKTLGRTAAATAAFRCAIILQPDQAMSHNNLGNILMDQGRPDPARRVYRRAVIVEPDFPEALSNLGVASCDLGAYATAAEACRRAIAYRPPYAEAHNNLGNALQAVGRLAEATAVYGHALRLKPDYPDPYNNLGTVLRARGLIDEAVASYERAIPLRDDPQFHLNYAMALLHQGQLKRGWAEYEWRWKTRKLEAQRGAFPQPEWNGEALEGRTILLYGEQGFGDSLQFVRYAPLLAAQGARVVIRVLPPLIRLLRTVPGVADVVSLNEPPPPFDYHLALMSVPRVFGTEVDTIPAPIPYLQADREETATWRERLAALPGRKVGLVWAGDPRPHDRASNLVDSRRSLTLDRFAALIGIPDLTLVSLQKGGPATQIEDAPDGLPIVHWMDEIQDFAGTAALVAALDLVITVDTSMAHLVGGLGKPVWILSRFDGCWRWLRDPDRTPWYPQARLYRQPEPGDWDAVLARVRSDLERFYPIGAAV